MADKPGPEELQAIQERENADRLGNEESARAAEKRLAAARATAAGKPEAATRTKPDESDQGADERKTPPKARQTRQEAKGTTA